MGAPDRSYFDPANFFSDVREAERKITKIVNAADKSDDDGLRRVMEHYFEVLGTGCYKRTYALNTRLVVKVADWAVIAQEFTAWRIMSKTENAKYLIPTLLVRKWGRYEGWSIMPRVYPKQWTCDNAPPDEDGHWCNFESIAEKINARDWVQNHVHLADTGAMFDYQFGF